MSAELFAQLVAVSPERAWQVFAMAVVWQLFTWTLSRVDLWLFLRLPKRKRRDALAWENKTPASAVDGRQGRLS